MSQNVTPFRWDARREKAAVLVAEDDLRDEDIAAAVEISRRQLDRWKRHPEFVARVAEHVKQLEAEALKFAIAKRRKRVDRLNRDWQRMQQVIAERAADEHAGAYEIVRDDEGNIIETLVAPGWTTGLLVRTEKQIGTGDKATRVVEYAVDTGLLREIRAHEEQAAKELGQWVDKSERENSGEMLIQVVYGDDGSDNPSAEATR